ncbi:hypothetical protein EDF66_11667 [Sphingobacterium sp. JUb20]|nr:hypothetical protein [Sphingobacterium sp. JUb21]TCQ98957.1 hypothetical protein EDF66_11667 [Sphingobacterium sp. JUb20]
MFIILFKYSYGVYNIKLSFKSHTVNQIGLKKTLSCTTSSLEGGVYHIKLYE